MVGMGLGKTISRLWETVDNGGFSVRERERKRDGVLIKGLVI